MNVCRKTAFWLVVAWLIGGLTATTAGAAPAAEPPAVPPSIGQPAPEFDLVLFSGKKVALKDFRGSLAIINFWTSG
jgi:cytochrome c biogenesis protein CcmG, thiol:disulfide interchange protein DsbE